MKFIELMAVTVFSIQPTTLDIEVGRRGRKKEKEICFGADVFCL